MDERKRIIVKTSVLGIITNTILAAFKAAVGLIANSLAIVLDAVINLSDALSSVVTVIGAKLAGKQPSKKHPYGYGRIEYLSAMTIGFLVVFAGVKSMYESIKNILHPPAPEYTAATFIILGVALAVKTLLGLYTRRVGKRVNSDSLENSGEYALHDSVISAATLIAALVYIVWEVALEAYLGAIISLFILKSGIQMIFATFSRILGERVSTELAHDIKETISSFEGIRGVYNLFLNNYGPDTYTGSVNVEVSEDLTAREIDDLTRNIKREVLKKHSVYLTAVGFYSLGSTTENTQEIFERISGVVTSHGGVLRMHGFTFNEEDNTVSFDLVMDYSEKKRALLYDDICEELKNEYPEFTFYINIDPDVDD